MDPSQVGIEYGQPMAPLSPAPPPPPPPHQQQQQSSVVVINSSGVPQPVPLIQSFAGHIVLACCTFWCCGVVFGIVAFILAGK